MSLASFRPATIVPRDPQCLLPWVCPIISALRKKKKNSQGPDNPGTGGKKKKQPGTGQPQDRKKKKKTVRDRTTLGPKKKKKSLIESRCPFSLRTVIRLAIVHLCASHYRQFVTEIDTARPQADVS